MEFKDIKRIAELMKANDLSEFELEDDAFRLAIKRGADNGAPVVYSQAPAPMASAPAAPAPDAASASAPAEAKSEDEGLEKITSPIVGTFYSSPSPDASEFIKVGDTVGLDTTVCIVEAMKVMNEIKAEVKGVVRKVLVENGNPVEYGEALFLVEPQ